MGGENWSTILQGFDLHARPHFDNQIDEATGERDRWLGMKRAFA
jgi:hypothetical protein